ncbi:uncharacterized protein METZ01_LOCUS375089 [marine metagenome]|uniref:Uncharacterized protein n=1 Tax=marine metagenome TaxID=408172 RepID=A0A382TKD7_9ZZZZ
MLTKITDATSPEFFLKEHFRSYQLGRFYYYHINNGTTTEAIIMHTTIAAITRMLVFRFAIDQA